MPYNPPARLYGCTRLCVVEGFSADNTGVKDATVAFQAAINALPPAGGTVHVPAGRYLIDAVTSVKLRSNMHIDLDKDAVLVAKPNSSVRYYVLLAQNVHDVEISGGSLIGDREKHNYVDTGNSTRTHEWGMGVGVRNSSGVTVRDLNVSNFTGDGVCVTGKDVAIVNVTSTNNRRQGLSITAGSDVMVYGGEFSYTKGTSPECGIDIEPDLPATTTRVVIDGAHLHNNNKYGVNVFKSSSDVSLKNCEIDNNVCGVVTVGCSNVNIANCYVHHNTATGIFIQDNTIGYVITGCKLGFNYTRQGIVDRANFTQTGWTSKIQKDILIKTTASGKVLTNNYI